MKTPHVICIGLISDKPLSKLELKQVAAFIAENFEGKVEKVLSITEISTEDIVKDMISKGVTDGNFGNAHIHVEQTEEVEEDPIATKLKDYLRVLKAVNEENFVSVYRSINQDERKNLAEALNFINKNVILSRRNYSDVTDSTKRKIVNLINLMKIANGFNI